MEREEVTVRRRVKLYLLNEENEWDDGGTGYVAVVIGQNQMDMNLLVNSEADSSALLDTKIDIDVAYQKQQDTLIVWFDNEAQNNLALSFQEAAGCDEIWAKICQVHGKPPSVKSTGDDDLDGSPKDSANGQRNSMNRMNSGVMTLPPCDLAHLDDLMNVIRDNSRLPHKREKLSNAIESGGYIQKLAQIFRMAEDLESSEILVKLYEIIKMLFHLNRGSLLDIMLQDPIVMDVVGILEYDPTLKEQAGHRKFLCDRARFHQVLPIKNKELLGKIERTFRLQYIQDIVQPLPLTILDTDTTLSALSSQIYFNKMDIVMSIQTDGPFLDQLFRQLMSSTYCDDSVSTASSSAEEESRQTSVASTPTEGEKEEKAKPFGGDGDAIRNGSCGSDDELIDVGGAQAGSSNGNGIENHAEGCGESAKVVEQPVPGKAISNEHRLELVLLLRELCNYAHSLQPDQRADFIKRLADHRICAALEQLLASESLDIRQAAIDIFASLVDFSPSMIRDYALHSSSEGEINGESSDDGLISLVIAELLNDSDPELGSAFHLANLLRLLLDPENMMTTSANRMEKVDFLSLFYKNCMHALVAPLLSVTADGKKPSRDDYKTALQLNLIVELLTFCLEVHGPHIRRYIIARDLIRRVLVLLKSKHVMLVLSALRFFRRTIGLKDPTYMEHITSNNLFEPVIEGMLNNVRDNMLHSAYHELFQFIRNEAIDELILHVVSRYSDRLPPNGNRPDTLGTFAWMRERRTLVQEQAASTPRHISVNSPEPPMSSPSSGGGGGWTSANSRAHLQYVTSGLPSFAGLSNLMRLGIGNSNNMLLQQQRMVNSPNGIPGSIATGSPTTTAAPTVSLGNGNPTVGRPGYLDEDELGMEDEERWFENDEPSTADNDAIQQGGGEGFADATSVTATNGMLPSTESAEEGDEQQQQQQQQLVQQAGRIGSSNSNNNNNRPISPQGGSSNDMASSEAVLDQLHMRMIEARRALADDDALSPARGGPSTATLIPVSAGGLKRPTGSLTISINVAGSGSGKTSPAVSPSVSTSSMRTSLVDYESDSDDNTSDDDDDSERKSKKKKGGSGADDDNDGVGGADKARDEAEKGQQQKRLRSSSSPTPADLTTAYANCAGELPDEVPSVLGETTATTCNSANDQSSVAISSDKATSLPIKPSVQNATTDSPQVEQR